MFWPGGASSGDALERRRAGQALVLKAERDKHVTETINIHLIEEIASEIDGEFAVEAEELLDQRRTIHHRHEANQLFNLLRL
jgi:hypothetical protein